MYLIHHQIRYSIFLFMTPFKSTTMVQTDLSQLHQDCQIWIGQLRNSRSAINDLRSKLQQLMTSTLAKSSLPEVEHYDNQFDIQLSNINHLKQAIRDHLMQSGWEENMEQSEPLPYIKTIHESLDDQCGHLGDKIIKLKEDFNTFYWKNSGDVMSGH